MKKLLLLILVIFFPSATWALSAEIVSANSLYDNENYEEARVHYLAAIRSGSIDGKLLYRLAYCYEKTTGSDTDMAKLYELASFYFEKDSDTQNRYYGLALAKLERLGLSRDSIDQTAVDGLLAQIVRDGSGLSTESSLIRSFLLLISEIISDSAIVYIFVFALLVYIVAQALSRKTECVIVWGWWDMIIFLIPGVILVLYLLNANQPTALAKYDLPLTIVFFLSVLATCVLSVVANYGHSGSRVVIFSLVSIFTKIVLLCLIPLVVALYLLAMSSGKSDKRYRDGTKNNERTAWLGLAGLVATILVGSLIKEERLGISE